MIVFVWNYRGLGRPVKIPSLREYNRSHRPGIVFISEVKISCVVRIEKIVFSLGFKKIQCVPSVGKSRGLLIMWKKN